MTTAKPRRSALYMPGANARALEKAKSIDADVLLLDLEDSVAPDMKAEARNQVCNAVRAGGYGPREVVIRVNGLDTPWFGDDLAAAVAAKPDAILIPKLEGARDVGRTTQKLDQLGAPAELEIWAMIETPRGLFDAYEAALAGGNADRNRLACYVLGTNDLAKETGAALGGNREPMLAWLSMTVAAARAGGLTVLDGVYNAFKDMDGFNAECAQGVRLGMDGKTLIHPAQVGPANAAFAPSDDAVAWAREILTAFEQPEAQGKGVITIDGKMVERLHAEMAAKTVAIAEAIAARGMS